MWALRRASNPLRSPGFGIGTARACCSKLGISSSCTEDKATILQSPPQEVSDRGRYTVRCYHNVPASLYLSIGRRGLSSQAGEESSEDEDDLVEGFSELETPINDEEENKDHKDELASESELSSSEEDDVGVIEEPDQLDLELSGVETIESEKLSQKKRSPSALFKAIMAAPPLSVHSVLEKWVAAGKELEISSTYFDLRKRRMYGRALQVSEWLEAKKLIEFTEKEYAARADLIAKVRGIQKAEMYVEKVPESFRGELVYRTLLANCVSITNVKKSEEVFNKMKALELPISTFTCNQLLLLYKRVDKKKIADVLLLMEKENVKLSLFTYRILIDTKGQSNDITGMEKIVETLKAEGYELDIITKAILARHYVSAGLTEKAEAMLKDMEGGNLQEHRWACHHLLPLYAELGSADDVERVWKVCEPKPWVDECMAAIEAWGKLGKVEQAEAVFDTMAEKWKRLTSKHYSKLLKVYADHKMVAKGKDLVKRMADSGCQIGPLTWDAVVKLYIEAGDVEKADAFLMKAAHQNQLKPMFSSFITIMEQYAKKGDIHNSEKIFHRMRQSGYTARARQFETLVRAYINGKAPAYGIRDRMRADNIFPHKALAAQLAQVDAFRKTAVSDLLD